eukprot:11306094-Ditylum_brightwellii.AAC.1
MEHSHASKKERLTLLDTKKKETVSEKKANDIERSGATKMTKTDNNTGNRIYVLCVERSIHLEQRIRSNF